MSPLLYSITAVSSNSSPIVQWTRGNICYMKKFCTSTFHSNGHISETKQDGNVKSSSHSRTETFPPLTFFNTFHCYLYHRRSKRRWEEEVPTKGSWGHHSPSDRSTSHISTQFMWHPPYRPTSRQICQRVRRIIEICSTGGDLDTGTQLLRTHLSFWHPLIFLWPFQLTNTLPLCALPPLCHCVHYPKILGTHHTYPMCNVCPRSTSTLSPSLLLCNTFWTGMTWVPHVWPSLTQCSALLPTAKTISWNLYLLQFLPTLPYSSSYVVSSEGRSSPLQSHIK